MARKISTVLVALLAIYWFYWYDGTRTTTSNNLRGKTVVITGASTGIGEQLAYVYSRLGGNMVIVARRHKELERVAHKCKTYGAVSVKYITADLGNIDETRRFVKDAQEYLNNTVDVLVLNHVVYNVHAWHAHQNITEVTQMFNINVISYIHLTTLFLTNLQACNGRLVVISSGLGVFTYPYLASYASNKHALHGFFNTLRQEININKTEGQRMSITIAVLGAIATKNAAIVSKGNPVAGEKGWTRFPPEDAASAIVEASISRQRQTYFPYSMKIHDYLSFLFPSYVERFIRYIYID